MKPALQVLLALVFACTGWQHAAAAKLNELVVVQSFRPGLWLLTRKDLSPAQAKYLKKYTKVCATKEMLLESFDKALSFNTHTGEETPECPTTVTKNLGDHGAAQMVCPATTGPMISMPEFRVTFDIRQIDDNHFEFEMGPGAMKMSVQYLGTCDP